MARLSFRLPALRQLAIPSVCFLIFFLAYSSQYLFRTFDSDPLTLKETVWFNVLVVCLWICYDRACFADAGRIPRKTIEVDDSDDEEAGDEREHLRASVRWCKKCMAVKPPRAHHCKVCERCIPKMDHHCPWTSNCVSNTTFPHFIRFVLYATVSMAVLEYFLFKRCVPIWHNRDLPSYLGPSAYQLSHLLVLILVNSIALFALSILLIHSIYSLATNTTMIESWEVERHEALLERAKKLGGFVYAPGGKRLQIVRQEFPYDIGIWKNICQGMGTGNVLLWFLPFGGAPSMDSGITWETNGFEDENTLWPPPDPDRMPRPEDPTYNRQAFVHNDSQHNSVEDNVAAFRRRQQDDLKRRQKLKTWDKRKKDLKYTDEIPSSDVEEDIDSGSEYEEGMDGEIGWTNSDGDRLRDYGVDEEADILDDDIPLSELLRRRKAKASE